MREFEQWDGFTGRLWKEGIDVRDFIQNNYTPYDGDEKFLEGPTEATDRLWGKLQELQKDCLLYTSIHLNENDTPYLYEPFRNQMPAKRQHPAEKEKILKPWQGLLVFAFLMVLFNLAGIPLVLAGGMYGNALDEIIVFLIGSILVVRALHIPLKEVFPLKKPDGEMCIRDSCCTAQSEPHSTPETDGI